MFQCLLTRKLLLTLLLSVLIQMRGDRATGTSIMQCSSCSQSSSKPLSSSAASIGLSKSLGFRLPKLSPLGMHPLVRKTLAGGLAGAFSTCILYPIDTIKTMRQSNKIFSGMSSLKVFTSTGIPKIYSGLVPATFGSLVSSSIYFGSYETAKRLLFSTSWVTSLLPRPTIHMLAAASGNLASSFVFVPKDVLKQQMQAMRTGALTTASPFSSVTTSLPQVVKHILKTKGLKGFYPSYRVTLLRNIPSAVVRFTVYEELRIAVSSALLRLGTAGMGRTQVLRAEALGYLLAGGIASALSSALTTPLDVVKTRLATGLIAPGTPIYICLRTIVASDGIKGLFVGVQERVLWSGLFGGMGLSAYECFKKLLDGPTEDVKRVEYK